MNALAVTRQTAAVLSAGTSPARAAPAGATLLYWTYAGGSNIGSPTAIAQRADSVQMRSPICAAVNAPTRDCYPARVAALRGAEVMTVTAHAVTGNPDNGTQRVGAESAPSNGLVPTQG